MESTLEQLDRLKKDGSAFTFANFSHRSRDGGGLEFGGKDSPEWLAWKTRVSNTINESLESNSAPVALVSKAMKLLTEGNYDDQFLNQKSLMLSAVDQAIITVLDDVFGETKRPKSVSSSGALSNRIFVVHGHDTALKTDLEVFLARIGLEPIVLHRQPDQGKTLIEKFEHAPM